MFEFQRVGDRVSDHVQAVIRGDQGRPLEPETRAIMEPRFGHDFSQVRVHAEGKAAESTRAVAAAAWTAGRHIAFGGGRYQPYNDAGRELIAHELAHVVQQRSYCTDPPGHLSIADSPLEEAAADRASEAAVHGTPMPGLASGGPAALRRKVEMRDVGSGERSGFARLPELIARLNAMATGVTFSVAAGVAAGYQVRDGSGALVPAQQTVELEYTLQPGKTPGYFEAQLMALIDLAAVLPLRLTSRRGLLGSKAGGFHKQVDVDAWTSGYVDIDDLLASSDLGLQSVLLHFLTERSATASYSRRIGSPSFTLKEFKRVHRKGIAAEEALQSDFFGDPTIRLISDSPSPTIRRVFRNSRGDVIRRRVSHQIVNAESIDASTIEVITKDGVHHTPEEYREILEREARARAPGWTEHWAGGRSVPAP